MADHDVVVIGAGHNGLTCACYLAKAGLKVLVVEGTDRVGGACVTEELFPGFRISTASYSLSLLLPEIIRDLGLQLDIRHKDPVAFAPHEDGGGLLLWSDVKKRMESIAEHSKKDAEAYERFDALWDEAVAIFRPLLRYPATTKQVKRAFRRAEHEDLYRKTIEGSIAELCEEHFESELLKGMEASQGIIGTAAGPRTPGTAVHLPAPRVRGGHGRVGRVGIRTRWHGRDHRPDGRRVAFAWRRDQNGVSCHPGAPR